MADDRNPTAEAGASAERFDERDSVFARERLVPGSVEEQLYHARHPEQIEADRRLRVFIESKQDPVAQPADRRADTAPAPPDWRLTSFYQTTFGPVAGLALPDMVDGPIEPRPVGMGADQAARRVKQMARFLGADLVGIGPLNPSWVYSHRGSPPFFEGYAARAPFFSGIPRDYADLKWGDPINLPHRFAIAMAFEQDLRLLRSFPSPAADLEVGRIYARAALVAVQLARFVRSLGYPARAHHLRNSAVIMPAVAVDAGLGELSRAGYLLIKDLGLNSRLAIVTTDLPMTPDPPANLGLQDFCQKCLKCAECCPAHCIPTGQKISVRNVRKWKIDEEKCLLYWGRIGVACTICQVVCPWSKPRTWWHRLIAALAIHVPASRRFLIWADDLIYGRGYRRKAIARWLER